MAFTRVQFYRRNSMQHEKKHDFHSCKQEMAKILEVEELWLDADTKTFLCLCFLDITVLSGEQGSKYLTSVLSPSLMTILVVCPGRSSTVVTNCT